MGYTIMWNTDILNTPYDYMPYDYVEYDYVEYGYMGYTTCTNRHTVIIAYNNTKDVIQ